MTYSIWFVIKIFLVTVKKIGRLYILEIWDSTLYIFIMYYMQLLYGSHGKSSGNKENKKEKGTLENTFDDNFVNYN